MTESAKIFRREALDFRAGTREQDTTLWVDNRWTRWLYWFMLALAAVATAMAFAIHTDETTSGPAWIDPPGRTFVALLPAAADLRPGDPVRLEVRGAGGRTVMAHTATVEVTDAAAARRAGFAAPAQPAVLVAGALTADAAILEMPPSTRQGADAVVILRTASVFQLFFDGVGDLLGGGGD